MNIQNKNRIRQKLASCLIVSSLLGLASPAQVRSIAAETQAAEGAEAAQETEQATGEAQTEESAPAGKRYDSVYDPALVHVDETLYVNLDYYGTIRSANVVKGISSSKNVRYQDYGSYSQVLNMTNDRKLDLTDEGASFDVDGNGKKFFFQGKLPADHVQLPWNVTVSYKLNGVPVEAEALRGASGLVEIDVKVTPNDAASEYLKNNMLLSVVIPADDTIYSVDAPGSQTQSVGDLTGVVFTALPGEEKEFVARLGTDSYESVGVILMMMPATLDSFDSITEIKDLKDTWKDSGDALYDSLNELLDVVASMRSEMGGLQQSLNSAESARAKISAARPGIFTATDEALASVMDLSVSVQKMIPYLSTAQTALSEINQDVGSLVDTLGGMTDSLHTLYRGLNRLEDGAYGAKYDVSDLAEAFSAVRKDQQALEQQLETCYQAIEKFLDWLEPRTSEAALFDFDEEELANISEIMEEYGYDVPEEEGELAEEEDEDAADTLAEERDSAAVSATASSAERKTEHAAGGRTQKTVRKAELPEHDLVNNLLSQLDGGRNLAERTRALLQKLRGQRAVLDHIATASNALLEDGEQLLSGAGKTAQGAKYTSEDLRRMIERTEDLNDTLDVFYPDMQAALTETQSLLGQTGTAIGNTGTALSMAHQTLKSASGDADSALSQSIQTSLSMIEKSFGVFDALDGLQSAGGTAKETLDGELDKFENENRFLDMDPNAEKVSFTSDRNKTPDSLQIVLRTDEISADDDEAEVLDADQGKADAGLWQRIKNVFIRIFEAIKEIFGEL